MNDQGLWLSCDANDCDGTGDGSEIYGSAAHIDRDVYGDVFSAILNSNGPGTLVNSARNK